MPYHWHWEVSDDEVLNSLTMHTTSHYKNRLAKQFSRAASHYDNQAAVQLDIANDALALLPQHCGTALDLGCGTGRVTYRLAQRSHQLIAVDLALGMLQHARNGYAADNILWLQGDAEHLALSDASVQTVFSSMVLQWCQSPLKVMQEVNRVLQPGGQAVVALMCEGSFNELQQVWAQLDNQRHINQFHRANHWQQAALDSGMQCTLVQKCYQTRHVNLRALLSSIKGIGANIVINPDRQTKEVSDSRFNRRTLEKLEAVYFALYGDNRQLPLSYHIAFLHCVKLKG